MNWPQNIHELPVDVSQVFVILQVMKLSNHELVHMNSRTCKTINEFIISQQSQQMDRHSCHSSVGMVDSCSITHLLYMYVYVVAPHTHACKMLDCPTMSKFIWHHLHWIDMKFRTTKIYSLILVLSHTQSDLL